MRVIILPGWLKAPLANANVSYAILEDVSQLESILSKEDVAFYLHAQLVGKQLLFGSKPAFGLDPFFGENGEFGGAGEDIKHIFFRNGWADIPEDPREKIRAVVDSSDTDVSQRQRFHANFVAVTENALIVDFLHDQDMNEHELNQHYFDVMNKMLEHYVARNKIENVARCVLLDKFIVAAKRTPVRQHYPG